MSASNENGLFKSGAASLYCSLVTSLIESTTTSLYPSRSQGGISCTHNGFKKKTGGLCVFF